MSSLYRTVTVKKVYNISVFIAHHLNFYMFWTSEVFLDKYLVIAEGFLGFVFSLLKFLRHILFTVYNSHASSAAAVRSF
ncbi:hypothetical protein SDC9_112183 [bioreactor metagenome]|uniref:Uncharacterized protein n=1 Tax=bioreactor metagenome TaxID=1076179 RepID=A0A645BJL5_9ZZZZ